MIDGWNIDDIMFIEARNGYSILYKYDANHFLYKKPLKEMDALLLNAGFVKIGKSALVNMRYIKKIENRKIIWNGFEPQNDIDGNEPMITVYSDRIENKQLGGQFDRR